MDKIVHVTKTIWITVHGRPTSPCKNRYDIALCYENTDRHRKDEAMGLFHPIRFVSVTSPYVVNKAEPIT